MLFKKNAVPGHRLQLPEEFSECLLKKNLHALECIHPYLVKRLCYPVVSSHFPVFHDGKLCYRRHQSLIPFTSAWEDRLPSWNENSREEIASICLFGMSFCGDFNTLLERLGAKKIYLWERDPWLLRLFLMRYDLTSQVREKKLSLLLGADIFDLLQTSHRPHILPDPVLKSIYTNELKLLQAPKNARYAVLCDGGLLIDQIADILRDLGIYAYTLDLTGLSKEELHLAVSRIKPILAISVNYIKGSADFFEEMNVPLLCWEIDPAVDQIERRTTQSSKTFIFTYRRKHVNLYKQAGFHQCRYLPLASDPEKRRPVHFSERDALRYKSQVAFVGSSMLESAVRYRDYIREKWSSFVSHTASLNLPVEPIEVVLRIQRENFSEYMIDQIVQSRYPAFQDYIQSQSEGFQLELLLGEIAAAEKRATYILNLLDFDVQVWGDQGWQVILEDKTKYRGYAGHFGELNKIYAGAEINLDINRIYQMDIVTLRVFDVLACGRFVLTEYSEALAELFEVGVEVEAYRTFEELREKLAYYLERRDVRERIARRGHRKIREAHNLRARVQELLEAVTGNDIIERVQRNDRKET